MRAALLAALGAFLLGTTSARGEELRGLWVVRTGLVSPAAVDEVVDAAAAGGLNALFAQVRGRGDALYRSSLVPRSPLLAGAPQGFDPLAHLIARAGQRGLEVHAWVNVLLVAGLRGPLPEGHVVTRHPEWLMAGRRTAAPDPDLEGRYLSPSATGAVAHLEAVVRELVERYPLRGLHLDFIRYPGPGYDEKTPDRRAALTALTERLARTARAAQPGIVVSAAVVPDEPSAVHQKSQDWPNWLARGILDAVVPMAYTEEDRIFDAQITAARGHVSPRQFLWAGVGAYRLELKRVGERIAAARRAGAAGVVLFSHESLTPAALRELRSSWEIPAPAAGTSAGRAVGGAGAAR
jgi:uncharacterized lipoprotein YddW (UPF0748 family)